MYVIMAIPKVIKPAICYFLMSLYTRTYVCLSESSHTIFSLFSQSWTGEAGGHCNSTFVILKSSMSLDTANIEIVISTAQQILS